MKPENVPESLVNAAMTGAKPGCRDDAAFYLANALPAHREMVLRDATKQQWEEKLGDLVEESIRANFITMIEKLTDERIASLADLIRADTRAKVSAEILAEAAKLRAESETLDQGDRTDRIMAIGPMAKATHLEEAATIARGHS